MSTVRVGRFKISRDGGKVSISPGMLKFKSTYCQSTEYDFGHDMKRARHEALYLCRWARNETAANMWHRLNNASHTVYMRFQQMTARRHGGRWVRGLSINNGLVTLNFE